MKAFHWPVRVYYEDTDAGGVVYHANYLNFMERARTEWLRSLGIEQDELRAQQGVIFVVRAVQVDYRLPAMFNDLLQVSARIVAQGKTSLTIEQQVVRENDQTLLSQGEVHVVCLNAEKFRPTAIPAGLLKIIIQGEE